MASYIIHKKQIDVAGMLEEGTDVRLIDRTKSEEYYSKYALGRTDVAILQVSNLCNIFYFVSGRFQIDLWDVEIDDEDTEKIRLYAEKMFHKIDPLYIQEHVDFFNRIGNTYGLM